MEDVIRAVSRLDLTALQPVNKWRSLCQKLYPDNCQRGRYRSLDGSCNNLAQPAWGKALTCHSRMGGPIYDDVQYDRQFVVFEVYHVVVIREFVPVQSPIITTRSGPKIDYRISAI
ncbi:unnamed protein product [Ixodes persulcatus]